MTEKLSWAYFNLILNFLIKSISEFTNGKLKDIPSKSYDLNSISEVWKCSTKYWNITISQTNKLIYH